MSNNVSSDTTNTQDIPDTAQIADRYRRLAARFTELVQAVPADRWDAASPCDGWAARDVLAHVIDTEVDFLQRMDFAPKVSIEGLDQPAAWDAVRDCMQGAVDDPAVSDHGYDGYFGPTTFGATIDQFYSFDLVVHAWDIAKAVGLPEFEVMPDGEVEIATKALGPIAHTMRMPGVFGPEVEVPTDADAQTKLLGIIGRAA